MSGKAAHHNDLTDSPLFLLATLYAARKARDRALERVTRSRLVVLGINVMFGDELPQPGKGKRNGVRCAAGP
jgi:hypothetical protein